MLEAAGAFAWLLLLVTLLHLALTAACVGSRARRIVAVSLLLAAPLPLGIGLLGVLSGRRHAWMTIETLAVPTPADLAHGNARILGGLVLGIAATLVCGTAALFALARTARR